MRVTQSVLHAFRKALVTFILPDAPLDQMSLDPVLSSGWWFSVTKLGVPSQIYRFDHSSASSYCFEELSLLNLCILSVFTFLPIFWQYIWVQWKLRKTFNLMPKCLYLQTSNNKNNMRIMQGGKSFASHVHIYILRVSTPLQCLEYRMCDRI